MACLQIMWLVQTNDFHHETPHGYQFHPPLQPLTNYSYKAACGAEALTAQSTPTPAPSLASGNVVEFRLLVSRVTYSFCLMSVALHLAAMSCTVPSGTRQWSRPRRRSAITAQHGIFEASAHHLPPTPQKTWPFSPPLLPFLCCFFVGLFVCFWFLILDSFLEKLKMTRSFWQSLWKSHSKIHLTC